MALLGLREFKAALARVAAQAEKAARDSLVEAASLAESTAKKNFEGSHAKGEPHVGGDKPNVVTGTLRRSIRTDPVTRYGLADYGTIVAPRVKYGRRVELGYPAGGEGPGHQASRAFPYFEPGARAAREAFPDITRRRWAAFLRE